MAVILYRDGIEGRFPADQLHSALEQGWTIEPEPEKQEEAYTETELEEAPETPMEEFSGYMPASVDPEPEQQENEPQDEPEPEREPEPETPDTEQPENLAEIEPDMIPMTNEQVRKLAREKGIPEWETARIRTLKAQLGIS